jgi:hypothetical protein
MLQLQLAAHSGALGTAIRTAPQWHDPVTLIRGSLAEQMLSYSRTQAGYLQRGIGG